jgi:hypothetical protein
MADSANFSVSALLALAGIWCANRGLKFRNQQDNRLLIKGATDMGSVVHRSRITITRESGLTRKAVIEGFDEPVFYGVHGGIKHFYKVDPEKEHADLP